MKTWKKILLAVLILMGVLIIFLFWYKWRYSMDVAKTFEVNDPAFTQRVLIATQGSDFKNEVVSETVDRLKSKPVYIKVIDVTLLPSIHEDEWSAIVILHTWEYQEAQPDAMNFITRATSPDKLVVVSTSGSGNEKIANVDGISSASSSSDVQSITDEIVSRVSKLLER